MLEHRLATGLEFIVQVINLDDFETVTWHGVIFKGKKIRFAGPLVNTYIPEYIRNKNKIDLLLRLIHLERLPE